MRYLNRDYWDKKQQLWSQFTVGIVFTGDRLDRLLFRLGLVFWARVLASPLGVFLGLSLGLGQGQGQLKLLLFLKLGLGFATAARRRPCLGRGRPRLVRQRRRLVL